MSRNDQPSEAKSSSGLASMFRRLKSTSSSTQANLPPPASLSTIAQLNGFRADTTSSTSLHTKTDLEQAMLGGSSHNRELLMQLKPGNTLATRIAAAEAFRAIVMEYNISNVSSIWSMAQDLTFVHNPVEARHAALRLLRACIESTDASSLDRLVYFRAIAEYHAPNDFELQLDALNALSHNGRDLAAFEREIQPLLSKWLKNCYTESHLARQARKTSKAYTKTLSETENSLHNLFGFLINIIKFSFRTFEEPEIVPMLNDILNICRKTTSKDDISQALQFVDALITYGYIPLTALTPCVEVLCGCYATLRDLTDTTWTAVSNLCRSYMAHNAILTMKGILENPIPENADNNSNTNVNTLRGAVAILERLLIMGEEDGLPTLQLGSIMESYQKALRADNGRLELEICRSIYNILSKPKIMEYISYDEWMKPLEILVACAGRISIAEIPPNITIENDNVKPSKESLSQIMSQTMLGVVTLMESQCLGSNFAPTQLIVEFFMKINFLIPDSCAQLIINYYSTEHLCYPSCSNWHENSRSLLDLFYRNKLRPTRMRINVLSMIKDVYETTRDVAYNVSMNDLMLTLFEDMALEKDTEVLEALTQIAVDVACDGEVNLFNRVIDSMVACLQANELNTEESDPAQEFVRSGSSFGVSSVVHSTLANVVAKGFVWLFMQNQKRSASKTVRVFQELVKIAGSYMVELDARLTAMKLLLRIRADSNYAICLVEDTESSNVASILAKIAPRGNESNATRRSLLAERRSEDIPTSGLGKNVKTTLSTGNPQATIARSASKTVIEKLEKTRPLVSLWNYPEMKPLPLKVSVESSECISSYMIGPQIEPQDGQSAEQAILTLPIWLDAIHSILEKGANWEVYSYVLVHFSSQLSNKALFMTCEKEMSLIRSVICDQLHNNKFPAVELPTSVKKADVAIVLIDMLTTLISYREYFGKSDQEAIIKSFQLGLHTWQKAAKPCIHALSICCYEMPGTTSKFLQSILGKLSQIITNSSVSVHILEFLSLLARMPTLSVNFTEHDFKTIFAIAFKYIQHTRSQSQEQLQALARMSSVAGKSPKENIHEQVHPGDAEVSQYVLTLAYNVLATWFLALRLNDRAKYVSWIVRGLVVGDGAGKENLDEESQACIDMLRRFTYADQGPKAIASRILSGAGQITTRNWLLDSKIISIHTSSTSNILQVIIRQPSASSSLDVKVEAADGGINMANRDKDERLPRKDTTSYAKDQLHPNILPSHIMMMLTANSSSPASRPILLPDEESVTRALKVFDYIPVVDFHKVGIIYIGAGQTTEPDILSNVMGSLDYTEFVAGLGDLVKLKDKSENTGGLDTMNDLDGEFTYAWSDNITQMIFHITTMMPTDVEHDPQCISKKRHIGNNFVNIMFNNSGLPFNFDTFPGQFNFINIVITPEARTGFVATRLRDYENLDQLFYRVQLLCKPGIPEISPVADSKMISGLHLSAFVRNLALNASVFSQVYHENGSEHISNWRRRLRAILTLRERHGVGGRNSTPVGGVTRPSETRRVSTATAVSDKSIGDEMEVPNVMDELLEGYDFSKWSGL